MVLVDFILLLIKTTQEQQDINLETCFWLVCIFLHWRKLDLAQDYTYPCIEPSTRLWMRRRRLTYSQNSYTSSQDFPRYFCMIYPSQSFLCGHKSSRTFAIPINVGEEPSSLSETKNTNGANEIMLEDTSEVGSPRMLASDEVIIKTISLFSNHLIILAISGLKLRMHFFHCHSRFSIQMLFCWMNICTFWFVNEALLFLIPLRYIVNIIILLQSARRYIACSQASLVSVVK